MKVQYDLEGGRLSQSHWRCSKLLLAAVLLVALMLGSALGSIWFQRYALVERTTATTTTTVETTTADVDIREEIAIFEISLDDEQGLSVNVNRDNGSLLSITEASSDLLKEFAGLVMAEAFAAIRELQEAGDAKHVDIPELPPVEASVEEIWSWSMDEGHEGFRIRFDNGEWRLEGVSREESSEETGSGSVSEQVSEQVSEGVEEDQFSTEAPEEVWSWSSQGFSGFRISLTDGKWSFETVDHASEEDSDKSDQVF